MKMHNWTLSSAFVGVGCIAPDEERLVLLKAVMQAYFILFMVCQEVFLYIYLYFKHQFLDFL